MINTIWRFEQFRWLSLWMHYAMDLLLLFLVKDTQIKTKPNGTRMEKFAEEEAARRGKKQPEFVLQKLNTKSFEQQTEPFRNKVRVSKVLAEQFLFSHRLQRHSKVKKNGKKEQKKTWKIKHEPVSLAAHKKEATAAANVQIFAMNKIAGWRLVMVRWFRYNVCAQWVLSIFCCCCWVAASANVCSR